MAAACVVSLPSVSTMAANPARLTQVPLPSGTIGAGFDDINYSPDLHRVLVPSGRTGRLFLLDPATGTMDAVEGFGTEPPPGGHGGGTTSADAGAGFVFAIDRSSRTLKAVDPAARRIVFSASLEGAPDIVRFVAPTSEVWVTEPRDQRIEIFSFTATGTPMLVHAADIQVPEDAPEALQVDAARHRLYTNQESGTTFAIDLSSRQVVATWPLGCGPTGLALDEKSGFLFVACADEGEAIVLDVAHGGKELARLKVGAGIDLFAYSPTLRHLYLPCSKSQTLAIVGVGRSGKLRLLETIPTAPRAHCGTTDDHGNVWVCDPTRGQLLLFKDRHPASRQD
jgi:DNA-binding beta-propeller fold protein YncE